MTIIKLYLDGYYYDQQNKIVYNKEQIKIQRKQYRDNNIEKIREKKLLKMTCECGLEINKNHRTRHIKTLKHIALLKKL